MASGRPTCPQPPTTTTSYVGVLPVTLSPPSAYPSNAGSVGERYVVRLASRLLRDHRPDFSSRGMPRDGPHALG